MGWDAYSKNEYAIPKLYDYRVFNVKLSARL
jgi:hypothetical protein